MPGTPWPILVTGTIARDDVTTPAGRHQDGLGGSATFFTLAARLFSTVRVIATVGADFDAAFRHAVTSSSVDLRGVMRSELPTYSWTATHDYVSGTTSSEVSEQGAYAEFEPTLLPDQMDTPIVFLGSMQPRYQLRVLDQLKGPKLVAGDTMRLYIREQRQDLEPVLERLDYLILNGAEAMALAKMTTVEAAAAELRRRYRLRGLIIKQGPLGATLYRDSGQIHVPAVPIDPPTDPTGAGDAVAGGFLGFLSERQLEDDATLRQAMAYAMVMASYAIGSFSVDGLLKVTRPEVDARLKMLDGTLRSIR